MEIIGGGLHVARPVGTTHGGAPTRFDNRPQRPHAYGGCFHALAWCPVRHLNPTPESAELRLCFSASVGFTRLSFQVLDANGHLLLYQRSPEHSASADAALVAAWADFGVAGSVWQVSPIAAGSAFDSELDAARCARARRELCRALYPLRMRVWAGKQLNDALLRAAEAEGRDDTLPPGHSL